MYGHVFIATYGLYKHVKGLYKHATYISIYNSNISKNKNVSACTIHNIYYIIILKKIEYYVNYNTMCIYHAYMYIYIYIYIYICNDI